MVERIVERSETEQAILRAQFLAFIDRCVNIKHMGVQLQGTSRYRWSEFILLPQKQHNRSLVIPWYLSYPQIP